MHPMYKNGRRECWRCPSCPGGPLEQEPWLSRRLGASSANLLCTRRMFEGRVKEKRGQNGVYRTRAGRAIFPGLPKPRHACSSLSPPPAWNIPSCVSPKVSQE